MNALHTSRYRILALPGSLRRDSYNRKLLMAAAHCAPPNLRISLFDELAGVPIFNEDIEAVEPLHPGVRRLREAVMDVDGLLIATPEYNQSIPGVLKNAIDWLSRPLPEAALIGKPVAIMGASGGRWGTRLAQAALRQTLVATEAQLLTTPMLFVSDAARMFDERGTLQDAKTRESLRKLLEAFAQWVERMGCAPTAAAA